MAKIKLTKAIYIEWYRKIYLMRKFEEKSAQLYGKQKIKGFCHLYNGQEALVAGAYSVLTKDDSVITAYRDHGWALGSGLSSRSVMAELFGKATGCSKGKGGSMHMFSKEHNFYGGHGIVGGQIPLGAGIAFAEKYRGSNNLCLALMGDGAVRQGALHEAFNMAMLWKLPVIFAVENNNYAMGTSLERTTNVMDIEKLGLGYDMPSRKVNGMSCEAVHEALNESADHIRAGKGPVLLNIETYRYRGHSMSDPAKYRTKDELGEYKELDPMTTVRRTILSKKWMTEKDLSELEAKIKEEILDSVDFAEKSPWPETAELFTDVYKQNDYPFVDQ